MARTASRNEHARRLVREIEDRGVATWRFIEDRKHPRLVFEWRGETVSVVFPGSTSDWRGPAKAVSWLRRRLNEIDERRPDAAADVRRRPTPDRRRRTPSKETRP